MDMKFVFGIFLTGATAKVAEWQEVVSDVLGLVGVVLMVAAGVVTLQVKLLEKKRIKKELGEN